MSLEWMQEFFVIQTVSTKMPLLEMFKEEKMQTQRCLTAIKKKPTVQSFLAPQSRLCSKTLVLVRAEKGTINLLGLIKYADKVEQKLRFVENLECVRKQQNCGKI